MEKPTTTNRPPKRMRTVLSRLRNRSNICLKNSYGRGTTIIADSGLEGRGVGVWGIRGVRSGRNGPGGMDHGGVRREGERPWRECPGWAMGRRRDDLPPSGQVPGELIFRGGA